MANVSFKEFYYTEDNQLHDLSEIQKEYKQNNGDISKYRGKMFCPECKKTELRFTHKTSNKREFLSKLPSSNHSEGCSFIHDYATYKEIKEFAEKLSDKQIQDRLEAALNQLLSKEGKEISDLTNDDKKNPFIIEVKDKDGSRIRKSIPRKSIKSWFDKLEEKKICIFYGQVKLQSKEVTTKNGIRYKWIVKIKKMKNEWETKTSIFRGTAKDNIDEEKIYDIAVLGEIEFYNDFPQIKTTNFSAIMFREAIV